MDSIEFSFIEAGHPLHAGELDLRYRVLRAPLGMTRESTVFRFEPACVHHVAVRDGKVVGCVLFHPESATAGRLLQMAVDPSLQGQGLGAKLVKGIQAELLRRGITHVHLHARADVVPFYEKLGYAAYGERYVEVGIDHQNMQQTFGSHVP